MPIPLPDGATIQVPSPLADALLRAAESLPLYDNQDFYSTELQASVHDHIRRASPSGFDWLIGEIKSRLAQRPYCALVQGIRYDEGNRLFVGINRAFGELVARPYEKPRAQLVHYIQPATDRPASQGRQFETEKLHTDTADWDPPVKWISMVCVRADPDGGGRSRVLDIDTLRAEVRARLGSRMLEFLALEPVPWLLAPYRGGGVRSRKSARAEGCGRARGTGGRRARAPCRRRWDSGRRPSRPRPGGGRGGRRAGPSGRR